MGAPFKLCLGGAFFTTNNSLEKSYADKAFTPSCFVATNY
jgi:hypothetical protein